MGGHAMPFEEIDINVNGVPTIYLFLHFQIAMSQNMRDPNAGDR
jgi:hypothetical protein